MYIQIHNYTLTYITFNGLLFLYKPWAFICVKLFHNNCPQISFNLKGTVAVQWDFHSLVRLSQSKQTLQSIDFSVNSDFSVHIKQQPCLKHILLIICSQQCSNVLLYIFCVWYTLLLIWNILLHRLFSPYRFRNPQTFGP